MDINEALKLKPGDLIRSIGRSADCKFVDVVASAISGQDYVVVYTISGMKYYRPIEGMEVIKPLFEVGKVYRHKDNPDASGDWKVVWAGSQNVFGESISDGSPACSTQKWRSNYKEVN